MLHFDGTLVRATQTLLDRQEIHDLVCRYCRAVDRLDRELLLSVYHPDAIDDHGLIVGGPEAVADWIIEFHGKHQAATQHIITNHVCELDGVVAHTETYWMLAATNVDEPRLSLSGGRYIDRFEKRGERWGIVVRKTLVDWGGEPGTMPIPQAMVDAFLATGVPSRDRRDPSYERPLRIEPSRVGFLFGQERKP